MCFVAYRFYLQRSTFFALHYYVGEVLLKVLYIPKLHLFMVLFTCSMYQVSYKFLCTHLHSNWSGCYYYYTALFDTNLVGLWSQSLIYSYLSNLYVLNLNNNTHTCTYTHTNTNAHTHTCTHTHTQRERDFSRSNTAIFTVDINVVSTTSQAYFLTS